MEYFYTFVRRIWRHNGTGEKSLGGPIWVDTFAVYKNILDILLYLIWIEYVYRV